MTAITCLLDDLEEQAVMFEGMARKAADGKDPMRVGVFGAWASATRQCLAIVRTDLPAIIDEAQLIPDPEESEPPCGSDPEPDREAVFGPRERCEACGHHDGYHADDCDRPR